MFVVIGYSFGDGHLNAIIRRWVSTRRKAKLIVVNPDRIPFAVLGTPYKTNKQGNPEAKTVDMVHIKKKTASAVDDMIAAAERPIDLSIPEKSGYLPDILVETIS